jgi:hypothetical protein
MTRWYAEKPQGLTGTGAPACSLGVSESVKSLLAGFGHGRVRVHDAIPMTANDGTARPMGTPGGSTG